MTFLMLSDFGNVTGLASILYPIAQILSGGLQTNREINTYRFNINGELRRDSIEEYYNIEL